MVYTIDSAIAQFTVEFGIISMSNALNSIRLHFMHFHAINPKYHSKLCYCRYKLLSHSRKDGGGGGWEQGYKIE